MSNLRLPADLSYSVGLARVWPAMEAKLAERYGPAKVTPEALAAQKLIGGMGGRPEMMARACVDCGTIGRGREMGRGLCGVCYARNRRAGTIGNFPPMGPRK